MKRSRSENRYTAAAIIVMACGPWFAIPDGVAQAEIAPGVADVERVVDLVRGAHDEAREALKKLPRDRFDTDPVLEASSYEAEAIVSWVTENTRWVPYRGVLRGADGVLLDHLGNSLDRSLLLVRLLEDAGFDARLARGELSAEAVEAILSMAAMPTEPAQPVEANFPDNVVAAAARAPGEAAALAELIGPLTKQIDADQESAAADHWWVEARVGNEWRTVDPLLSGSLAAMRPDPTGRFTPDSLPASLFHHVTIRVVIERWDDGGTIEEVPLEHRLRSAEAVYHDLELLFAPYHFESAPAGSTAAAQAALIAETAREWLPVLRRGDQVIQQLGFDRQGNLERDPGRVAVARKTEAATSALQALGGATERASQLTALWLEYRVEVPDQVPRTVRRELFDLLGPDRRANGAVSASSLDAAAFLERGRSLLGGHRILVTSAALPQITLEKAGLELWANQGPQIAAITRLVHGSSDPEVEQRAYREPLVALDLLALATARHQLSPHGASIYLAHPNILTTHFTVDLGENSSIRKAFDIVVNDVGVTANGGIPPARIRLEQGVLDTILEAELLDAEERLGNAADLFALRDDATVGWQRIVPASSDMALPRTAHARIASALAAGRTVVAPTRLGRDVVPAWWEIDPVTGTTLGIGINGWGVAEETVRGIGTSGFLNGARRYSIEFGCNGLIKVLKASRKIVIFFGPPSTTLYMPEAVELMIQLGCSIVV